MNIIRRMFEVRVKVGQKLKSYHYEASSSKDAARQAKGRGRVIFSRKVDVQALLGNIENLNLNEESENYDLGGGVFEEDLNLDEALGLRKKTKRRSSNGRTYKDTRED